MHDILSLIIPDKRGTVAVFDRLTRPNTLYAVVCVAVEHDDGGIELCRGEGVTGFVLHAGVFYGCVIESGIFGDKEVCPCQLEDPSRASL